MRTLKLFIILMTAVAFSAYKHYTKPNTLYQYHRITSELEGERDDTPTANTMTDEERIGKNLFKANCASCHNKNMRDELTGPALGGVENRWADFPKEDLYKWIRNSKKLESESHPRAVELYKKYDSEMPNFVALTDADIEALLAYIRKNSTGQ